jgi:hypothetical protein
MHFILLEFLDPTVNTFLWKVREILGGKRSGAAIHLTIRGPYEGAKPSEALQAAHEILKNDVFLISGVGRFSNDQEEVVFFRVDSPNLRSVWWKPTFPIEQFGFKPHISIYRGHDAEFASTVHRFLASENIQLLCAEHRLVWYEAAQPSLLSPRMPSVGDMIDLDTSGRVDISVLDRLEGVVSDYRSRKAASTNA